MLAVHSGYFLFLNKPFQLGFKIRGLAAHGFGVLSKNNIRSHDLKNI